MNQIEFMELSKDQQLVELLSKGTFVAYIIKGVYMVKLFQMKDYYIETYYHIEKNRFDSVIAFDDTDKLTPYLKKNKLVIYPSPPPHTHT